MKSTIQSATWSPEACREYMDSERPFPCVWGHHACSKHYGGPCANEVASTASQKAREAMQLAIRWLEASTFEDDAETAAGLADIGGKAWGGGVRTLDAAAATGMHDD